MQRSGELKNLSSRQKAPKWYDCFEAERHHVFSAPSRVSCLSIHHYRHSTVLPLLNCLLLRKRLANKQICAMLACGWAELDYTRRLPKLMECCLRVMGDVWLRISRELACFHWLSEHGRETATSLRAWQHLNIQVIVRMRLSTIAASGMQDKSQK